MSQVSVTINGRVYRMACDDGQEDYLVRLARELDVRIAQLRETFGEIGDTRLAVTAAIMLADEVSELRKRMRATEQEIESLHQEQLAATEKIDASERAFADAIDQVAERIERLAHGLSNGGLREDTAVG
jgi:cell division protein ZapA